MFQINVSNFGSITKLIALVSLSICVNNSMSANVYKSGEFIRVDCQLVECISSMTDFDDTERKMFGQISNVVVSGATEKQIIKTYPQISGTTTKLVQAIRQPPNTLVNKASYYLVDDESNKSLTEPKATAHLEVYFVNGTAYSYKVFTHQIFHVVTVFLDNPLLKD